MRTPTRGLNGRLDPERAGLARPVRVEAPPPVRALSPVAVFFLVALSAFAAGPSGGQVAPGSAEEKVAETDSSALLSRARELQRRFEIRRVGHLPRGESWGGGECDDVVGRMCWRHGTGGDWVPEPEATEIVLEREKLLAGLAEIGDEIPGDAWVLGQRVWYLGEAGRWSEALELARRCGPSERWWCHALEGLVLHVSGRYPGSLEAFERALTGMDQGRATEWRAVEVLLDRDALHALREERAEDDPGDGVSLRRIWALADPLYLVEGNDRLTEHYARRTVALLRSDAENPHGIRWGDDMEELLIRYGWAVAWERTLGRIGVVGGGRRVVGHEHPESRGFVPPGEVLRAPVEASGEDLTPELAYARSAYAPRYAPTFLPATSSLSVFPRGDSATLVAAFRLPVDTTRRTRKDRRMPGSVPGALADRGPAGGLFVRDADGAPFREARLVGTEGAVALTVPAGEYVVSVEAWDPARRLAGRRREGRTIERIPDGVVGLSDLLLIDEGPEPGSLDEALGRVMVDPKLVAGGHVRVAWGLAGLGTREEVLSYHLSLLAEDGGVIERLGRWLGLGGEERPARLSWEESSPPEPGMHFRSVVMEIPELDAGSYLLRLELATRGRATAVTERRVEVVPVAGPGG